MNLYRINPDQDFLDRLADFVLENFKENIDDVRIILPTRISCISLQKNLLQKMGIGLLPSVMPFSDISAESEEIFKVPLENLSSISYLEEKIILAEIIHSYKKLDFSITQALSFSTKLAQLFYEFKANNIDIKSIKELPELNQAEHWQYIYEFLNYAFENWQERLKQSKKLDKATYQKNNLEAEIRRLEAQNSGDRIGKSPQLGTKILIVAGIFGNNPVIWNFLKNIASMPQGYIILPPISSLPDDVIKNSVNQDDTLFFLQNLLTILQAKISDFKSLTSFNKNSALDNLITSEKLHSSLELQNQISYFEYETIFEEALAISLIAKENRDKKIAIILNNENNKSIYQHYFTKYDIKVRDFFGDDLGKYNITSFINVVSEFLCNPFNVKDLFTLLKHPFINCDHTCQLEQLIIKSNRFVNSAEEIQAIILQESFQDLKKDDELTESKFTDFVSWTCDIISILGGSNQQIAGSVYSGKPLNFHDILQITVTTTKKLIEKISPYTNAESTQMLDFLTEILDLCWNYPLPNAADFPETLKLVTTGGRSFRQYDRDANVSLCSPQDAALEKHDIVILPNFNDGNWPVHNKINPWMNKQMEADLSLYSGHINNGLLFYNFYLLLHNKQVIITRAKTLPAGPVLASSYLLKLEFILNNVSSYNFENKTLANCNQNEEFAAFSTRLSSPPVAKSPLFPSQLSASDIEMLIRSPYSFYAKKILKLKKAESIIAPPKLSEFGSFVHNVIEIYTKNYHHIKGDKKEYFINLSKDTLKNFPLPSYAKYLWQTKLAAIAKEFIKFDESCRADADTVHSEIRGEMMLDLGNGNIKIVAIADRIDITHNEKITIYDYKTGSTPTKKDVASGMSPQLIIEALIALSGGFKELGLPKAPTEISLVYVKIGSSTPYFNLKEISISQQELAEHKGKLINLLKHYYFLKEFPCNIDLLKYNDYKHLMRN